MISQIIIDDFHPVAIPIAVMAKGIAYGPQEHEGHVYKGIGLGYVPELFYEILGNNLGRIITPNLHYFRLGTKEDSPTTYIHADSGCSKYAAVWYLTEAPDDVVAGTAFWKHKATGLEQISEQDRAASNLLQMLDADGADESKWKMVGLCGQKFNRCVVYPTNIFHSRYPQDAWGNNASNGRIVFTSFFD